MFQETVSTDDASVEFTIGDKHHCKITVKYTDDNEILTVNGITIPQERY